MTDKILKVSVANVGLASIEIIIQISSGASLAQNTANDVLALMTESVLNVWRGLLRRTPFAEIKPVNKIYFILQREVFVSL